METQTQTKPSKDRIQKNVLLRAPRERVWRAISDPQEFGSWFGMTVDGRFTPGAKVKAAIAPTQVDPEIAKQQRAYEGVPFELTIDRVEPERLLSFRWHPGAVDRSVDYSVEPTTLVAFELESAPDGVMLKVTESGFDQLPAARRAAAFAENEEGWSMQMKLVEKYVAAT